MSLKKIENLIYKRDCLKNRIDKLFESITMINDKLRQFNQESLKNKQEFIDRGDKRSNTLIEDHKRLKELLMYS